MRSVRMLLATATATAALAITPAAYAVTTGDWDQGDSSHSKEHEEPDGHGKSEEHGKSEDHGKSDHDQSYSKEHEEEGEHDGPRGGVHTGGGALAVTNGDDWGGAKDPKHDPDSYRSKEGGSEKGDWGGEEEPWKEDHGKDSWKGDNEDSWGGDHDEESWRSGHDKPHGGMHTGGGGLASSGVTAGGLAALAVAGTGIYALRRKKASGSVA
ncbi:hypothetical protein [Streptomyces sp. NPDC056464]|uniref:hypothetical protein n=1 Tax=Streptomyces sp. NPDC056464 TaxID=3345828 RepID=UPI0036BEFE05